MPNRSSSEEYPIEEEDRYSKKYFKQAQVKYRKSRSRSRSYSNYRAEKTEKYRSRSPRSRSRERSTRKYDRSRRAERSSSAQKKSDYEIPPNQISANNIIGVFGLSVYTKESKIREIFEHYGTIKQIHMIIDAKTRKSRGFCFIYYRNIEDATEAKKHCDGMVIDERKVRVDYSVTTRAHSPTPGYYLGRPTKRLMSSSYRNGSGRSYRGGSGGGMRRGGGSSRFPPRSRGSGRDRSPPPRHRSPPPRSEKYGRERLDRSREVIRRERPRSDRRHERSLPRYRSHS